ncbi:MAG: hypothetical protein ACRDP2_14985 [Nocardioidaceae bacterium]
MNNVPDYIPTGMQLSEAWRDIREGLVLGLQQSDSELRQLVTTVAQMAAGSVVTSDLSAHFEEALTLADGDLRGWVTKVVEIADVTSAALFPPPTREP